MPEEITIDKIRTALGDPKAPWYGSDVVSLVGDLIEDYADLKEVQQADYASAVRNCEEANKLTAENDKLNKRIKELEELLIEYGRHSPGCAKQWNEKYPCRCGWDREREQALKETKK